MTLDLNQSCTQTSTYKVLYQEWSVNELILIPALRMNWPSEIQKTLDTMFWTENFTISFYFTFMRLRLWNQCLDELLSVFSLNLWPHVSNSDSWSVSVVQAASVGEPRSHSDLVQERPRGPVSCGPQRTLGGESQVNGEQRWSSAEHHPDVGTFSVFASCLFHIHQILSPGCFGNMFFFLYL